jgi:ATP-binding cassette subfamily F protein uup
VFEHGNVREYVGGYDDWLHQRDSLPSSNAALNSKPPEKQGNALSGVTSPRPAKKLSYGEKRELELLPARIESLEHELAMLQQKMSERGFYQQPPDAIAQTQAQCKVLGERLAEAYERWESLESDGD